MTTSDQSSFTRAEPMGDEALAALRSLAQAGITPTQTATLSLLARLDATHDNSIILARDLDDALARLHRAEKDRDAKAEALRLCSIELRLCSQQLAGLGRHRRDGGSVSRALSLAAQALTTPPTEEESA